MNVVTEIFDAIITKNHSFAPFTEGDIVEVTASYGADCCSVMVRSKTDNRHQSFYFTGGIFDCRYMLQILPKGYNIQAAKVLYGR